MKNLKWQIHAETAISQMMFWAIIMNLFTDWYVDVLAAFMIIGNIVTAYKSANKLPKDYFK